ncbi:ferritin-like domain-containing protein [Secundilactobacillus kimchicus]|uniref:Putative stress induced DNA binding protein (Putative) n=1 Tax=Secundilactobacillus kimchicus JCM 15530 TaxID=1302272 RepID=A0A0R1HNK2_9LACO|nr:ferritin-like domain-containing protein [Secundilactobacillus kimchicus]KRK48430.1 putative stress induced DNA binding protein (putative) [Secundilactobacillus kimchicus JCM 15530]MBT9671180.1 DNA starvation/stationary phase protection protein [Secundilactobacillus kimchicus]
MTTVEAQYQAEIKQAELDHHTPTAGAMAGHIVANLHVFDVKLHQAKWFLKGPQSIALRPLYEQLIEQDRHDYDVLAESLLDENELPPSTTAEYGEYAMLEEDGRTKYKPADDIVNETIHDLNTQNLFITRAIKLANNEDRPAMAALLTTLLSHNNHSIRQLQAVLGHNAWDGLVEEDDD